MSRCSFRAALGAGAGAVAVRFGDDRRASPSGRGSGARWPGRGRSSRRWSPRAARWPAALVSLLLPLREVEPNQATSGAAGIRARRSALAMTLRSGPVVIEIDCRVAQDNARDFYNQVLKFRPLRLRNGAYDWSICPRYRRSRLVDRTLPLPDLGRLPAHPRTPDRGGPRCADRRTRYPDHGQRQGGAAAAGPAVRLGALARSGHAH